MRLESVVLGVGLVPLSACRPSDEPGWTIAVQRDVAEGEGEYSHRLWLVYDDGREDSLVPIPPEPNYAGTRTPYTQFVGWSPDGRGFYAADRADWFFTDGRFEPLRCDDIPYAHGCIVRGNEPLILSSGELVVPYELSSAHFPGVAPLPRAHLLVIDHEAGTSEIVDETHEYACVSAAPGGLIVATEVLYTYGDDLDMNPSPTREYRTFMLRDGVREDIAGLTTFDCSLIAPTGDLVAWPAGAATRVTDLDGRELHVVPHHRAAAWTSDGRWLGGNDFESVWLLDTTTGQVDRLELPEADAIHFSPDGRRLAVQERCTGSTLPEPRWQLRIYEDVGRWEEVWAEPCDTQHWIDWTPDGERFARQLEEDGVDGFHVISVVDGERGPFIEGRGLAFRPEG
ncbi:TolB family protein [Paraliomyxa miuraensis]|uniref:TolB family protein n=1 Tax=Paraliomyxa miuraensis TaxID=376150 RepID=UPI0022502DC0|nr:hypothetical protein [Paraliomyxa miuraensis]MCX4246345.1 hypothetical protein [Paraliomyxa miuraensis]